MKLTKPQHPTFGGGGMYTTNWGNCHAKMAQVAATLAIKYTVLKMRIRRSQRYIAYTLEIQVKLRVSKSIGVFFCLLTELVEQFQLQIVIRAWQPLIY